MRVMHVSLADHQRRYVLLDEEGHLVEPVVRYLKHLDRRGYARNTLAAYATALKWYWEYLTEAGLDWRTPGLDSLAEFINWLRLPFASDKVRSHAPVTQARSNATINDYLTALTGFYDYMWRVKEVAFDLGQETTVYLPDRVRGFKGFLAGIADERPVAKHILKQQESKRERPPTITREQVQQLRAACENQRDHLLVGLLYETAIRIGEALALWVEDLDMADLQIHIRDRGPLENRAEIKTPDAERSLPISEALMHELVAYVAVAHTVEVQTNHLFLKAQGQHAGRPLEYADVNSLFRRLRRKTGIDVTPHILRHTALTALAEEGWAPELIQARAGHASFQYTYQTYIHPSKKRMREEWERIESIVGSLSTTSQEKE